MEVVWFKYGVAVHAQPGCRCDDMDLVGMCCPAHSVCVPTSANACTARNTATLDVHCACASPTSLYRALRNSTMYEYSLPVGQHFTRGMNSTQRPAVPVLQGSHFPNAGARCVCSISGCGRGIPSPAFVWLPFSTNHTRSLSSVYFLQIS